MTIDRIKGLMTVTCDGPKCHSYEEESTFFGLLEKMRELQWHKEELGGEWFHYCPDCVASGAKDRMTSLTKGLK